MAFNSIPFILFFLVTSIVFFIIPKKAQWVWLLFASCYFYSFYNFTYFIFLTILILFNYFFGKWIYKFSNQRKAKGFYIAGLLLNIATLVFFKYFIHLEFINKQLKQNNGIFENIILPLGLSYLVFALIAYLIEVKRGNITAESHPGIFALSYLFFPKITQGPIEKPQKIICQFHDYKTFDYSRTIYGLKLLVWGFFKKLVIADRLAIYVDSVYNNYEYHTGSTLLVATFFYSFQIYADFSGYTDVALGAAKVLGFDLTNNFRRPYFARSIKEFWNRWHITFSIWLRDYIFLPLAYKLSSKFESNKILFIRSDRFIYSVSILITFFVCGVWHGDTLNFLIWGLLFGVALTILNLMFKNSRKIRKRLNLKKNNWILVVSSSISTFIFVSFAWIFFRAVNFKAAIEIIKKISRLDGSFFIGNPSNMVYSIVGIMVLVAIEFYQERKTKSDLPFENHRWFVEQMFYALLIITILLIGALDGGQFIYFKF